MRDSEAGSSVLALACARTGAWAAAGSQTGAAPGGGWGLSLITAAEPQNSPSKARTTRARLTLARRCRPRKSPDRSWRGGKLGFSGPRTLCGRLGSAQPGRDAEWSKMGIGCLCPLFVPEGFPSSVWLAMPDLNKSGDCHNGVVQSGLPRTRRDALWCEATMLRIDCAIVLRHSDLEDTVLRYNRVPSA